MQPKLAQKAQTLCRWKEKFDIKGHDMVRLRMGSKTGDSFVCKNCRLTHSQLNQAGKVRAPDRQSQWCVPYQWDPNAIYFRPRMVQWRALKRCRQLDKYIEEMEITQEEIQQREQMRSRVWQDPKTGHKRRRLCLPMPRSS